MIGGKVLSCCSNLTINHSQRPAGYDRIKANETLWCFTEQHTAVFLRLPLSPARFLFLAEIFETPALTSSRKNGILYTHAYKIFYIQMFYKLLIKHLIKHFYISNVFKERIELCFSRILRK